MSRLINALGRWLAFLRTPFTITIQHQLDPKTRDLIAQQVAATLASQNADFLRKVCSLMSALDDQITAGNEALVTLNTAVTAVAQEVADLKSAPSEPTADQLAALGTITSGITSAAASLTALVPQASAIEPVVTDPQPEQPAA